MGKKKTTTGLRKYHTLNFAGQVDRQQFSLQETRSRLQNVLERRRQAAVTETEANNATSTPTTIPAPEATTSTSIPTTTPMTEIVSNTKEPTEGSQN